MRNVRVCGKPSVSWFLTQPDAAVGPAFERVKRRDGAGAGRGRGMCMHYGHADHKRASAARRAGPAAERGSEPGGRRARSRPNATPRPHRPWLFGATSSFGPTNLTATHPVPSVVRVAGGAADHCRGKEVKDRRRSAHGDDGIAVDSLARRRSCALVEGDAHAGEGSLRTDGWV